jgi:hypothetical protein
MITVVAHLPARLPGTGVSKQRGRRSSPISGMQTYSASIRASAWPRRASELGRRTVRLGVALVTRLFLAAPPAVRGCPARVRTRTSCSFAAPSSAALRVPVLQNLDHQVRSDLAAAWSSAQIIAQSQGGRPLGGGRLPPPETAPPSAPAIR